MKAHRAPVLLFIVLLIASVAIRSTAAQPLNLTDVTFTGTITDIESGGIGAITWTIDVYQVVSGPYLAPEVDAWWNSSFTCEGTDRDPNLSVGDGIEARGRYESQSSVAICGYGYYIRETTLDNSGPSITNVRKSADLINKQGCPSPTTVTIRADVIDASGLALVELSYQPPGESWRDRPMSLESGNTFQVTVGPFSQAGILNYFVYAYDNEGNRSETAVVTVTVNDCGDTEIPSIHNIRASEDPINKDGCPDPTTVTIRADVSDESGLARVWLDYAPPGSGSYTSIDMTLETGNTYKATVGPFSQAGTLAYGIGAEDNAGNWSHSDTHTVTVKYCLRASDFAAYDRLREKHPCGYVSTIPSFPPPPTLVEYDIDFSVSHPELVDEVYLVISDEATRRRPLASLATEIPGRYRWHLIESDISHSVKDLFKLIAEYLGCLITRICFFTITPGVLEAHSIEREFGTLQEVVLVDTDGVAHSFSYVVHLKTIHDRTLKEQWYCPGGAPVCFEPRCDAVYAYSYSPVDLLLTDSQGRRTGRSRSGSVMEIPNSAYSGPDAEEEFIIVYAPASGIWNLDASGTGYGTYDLLYAHYDGDTAQVTGSFMEDIPTGPGDMDAYQLGIRLHRVQLPLLLNSHSGSWPRNTPPHVPSNPSPPDGATNQSVNVNLGWAGGDPDGDPVTYDVYLEANDSTPDVRVSHNQAGTTYDPGTLGAGTHYYWKIVAGDSHGATRTGPVWDFSTVAPPTPVTPTPTYTRTPTPTATPPSGLLFFDDFSDPTSGWEQKSTDVADRFYDGGEYHVLTKQQNWVAWGKRAQVFSNFDIRLKVRAVDPPTSSVTRAEVQSRSGRLFDGDSDDVPDRPLSSSIDGAYGFLFRYEDADNYYYFAVSPSTGKYRLNKQVNDEWVSIRPWTRSSHINSGTATNELRVVAQGSEISLYVNGRHLIDITDASFSQGLFTLVAQNFNHPVGMHAAFDDFAVYNVGSGSSYLFVEEFDSAAGLTSTHLEHVYIDEDDSRAAPNVITGEARFLHRSLSDLTSQW